MTDKALARRRRHGREPAGRRQSTTPTSPSPDGAVLLLVGLGVAGGLAATLTPTPQVAVADESQSALLRTGKQLFDTSCITCHGANLQGVQDRGPSLIGVGEAAVYFQVSTGRMPAMRGEAQAPRKAPIFDEAQIDALGAYVQANGGGPLVPRDANGQIAEQSLLGNDVARGGDLFRLNCASCHNFTGKGGALSSGKYAPDARAGHARADLHRDADRPAEHAQVLRPPARPRRRSATSSPTCASRRTARRTPAATASAASDPSSEGMAIWIIGMVAVIAVALWIGARAS